MKKPTQGRLFLLVFNSNHIPRMLFERYVKRVDFNTFRFDVLLVLVVLRV